MTITTLDQYLGGFKQNVIIAKTGTTPTTAGNPYTMFNMAGQPAAGALSPGNTTTGVVPTSATTGFPVWNAPNGSNKQYLSRVEAQWSVAGTIALYDVLFWAGAVTIPTSGTTVTSLSSQPSYASRVPHKSDGVTVDYSQCELWAWSSTAWSNHAHSVTVTYVDQDNNTAEATANASTQNQIVNRMIRIPLNSPDSGVRQINSFTLNGITSATGAVVVLVMRKLFAGRVNFSANYGPDQTGMPILPGGANTALMHVVYTDSNSTGTPSMNIEIVEG